MAIQRGTSNDWRMGKQHDITLTMTTLILIVALIWATFFIFIVRFELRNELDSLLVLFQCSKRGLRFLGVVAFHLTLLGLVTLLVSVAVERSIPNEDFLMKNLSKNDSFANRYSVIRTHPPMKVNYREEELEFHDDRREFRPPRINTPAIASLQPSNKIDRVYLLTVYKIWLTAIVYAFLYLTIENVVMFYADMSLVEFVHTIFLQMVAKSTGIDLSDYPAGEMHFNPLVRRAFVR